MNKKVRVKVIIGANYGDEGKGLATHYFAQQEKKLNPESKILNVLFSGGSQRGHTVDLENGKSHVFHHFGSATFDGADTYFDQDFMVNPMEFVREYDELNFDKYPSAIYIDPLCRVVTPYDIFINQIVEKSRGENRHGSCGCGIWETKVRNQCSPYDMDFYTMKEMCHGELKRYLEYIRSDYLLKRMDEYGVKNIPDEYKDLINSDSLMCHYIEDFEFMASKVNLKLVIQTEDYDSILFEGSQGLGLDCNNMRMYPYVTVGNTGVEIPLKRIKRFQTHPYSSLDIEICFVTRSYLTRHGAGYLPNECDKSVINSSIVDNTNVYNDYQGNIRYGLLDYNGLYERIAKEKSLANNLFFLNGNYSLMVTHLNECDEYNGRKIYDLFKLDYPDFGIYTSDSKYALDVNKYC